MTDRWLTARKAFERGESLRAIAATIGVSHTAVLKRARRGGWERHAPGTSADAEEGARAATERVEATGEVTTDLRDPHPPAPPPRAAAEEPITAPDHGAGQVASRWDRHEAIQRRLDAAFAAMDDAEADGSGWAAVRW